MDFREEFEAYEREHPYREFPVQGGRFRYILSGENGKPAIVFLNGLGMGFTNVLVIYGILKGFSLLMPVSAFRLGFTNGLMSESMIVWFGFMLWKGASEYERIAG